MAAGEEPAPAALALGEPAWFRISIPSSHVERLQRQLADTELPEEIVPDVGWEYGLSLSTLRELKSAWEALDWRKAEDELNRYEHFKVRIEGLSLHYVHARSPDPGAIPLLMMHGYPSTFAEFLPLLPSLTHPPAGEQAFHVVLPSVPGFGFSSAPPRGWKVGDTARVLDMVMTGVLGYERYASHGGDWGFIISSALAVNHLQHCLSIHLNLCAVPPPLPLPLYLPLYLLPTPLSGPLIAWFFTPSEQTAFSRTFHFLRHGGGIFPLCAQQPALIGYALSDLAPGAACLVRGDVHHPPVVRRAAARARPADRHRPLPVLLHAERGDRPPAVLRERRCVPRPAGEDHEVRRGRQPVRLGCVRNARAMGEGVL
ncbi:alpha/beta-hydrolase [Calocera cornea HHB12733]|uniref:Alpha/beta-hydrolase n=1 Tax=Calocera cornea HHB12733 TaxID=1353952 RepID=A0A165ILM0_9BASI|nr:alpha/beta-hydrolase [Calocera cornea HHB12733]